MEDIKKTSTGSSTGLSGVVWAIIIIAILLVVIGSLQAKTALHPAPSAQATPMATQLEQATVAVMAGSHSIYGAPTLTVTQINTILVAYHSPAAGQGQTLYDLSVQYGIDDAFPLAFFLHESSMGTQGEATVTHSLGNLRCIDGVACIDQSRGGYAAFANWHDGFQAWFVLITGSLYKGAGLTTVETIIPRYAPTADNNDEQAYINALIYCVNSWRSGKVMV